ncbi:MAG: peptidoglycan-binding protein [Acidobacteria bacterium]|nr:MAG: peptidoglycan-binding protein [Acidobacteriota bacterium]
MPPSLLYAKAGLLLTRGRRGSLEVEELQKDLRRLAYLRTGIDGDFGKSTEQAVRALQHDLLRNEGKGSDGNAPVRVIDYNRSRVVDVDGVVTAGLAGCIRDMLEDENFPKVPSSPNPKEENRKALGTLAHLADLEVPIQFLLAILRQESGLKHFCEPTRRNHDSFVVVGLDTNASEKHVVTSRGYGIGQFTIFHHPPTGDEVEDFVVDSRKNVTKAEAELKDKFALFVNGSTSGTRADDRFAEAGGGPLRVCKHSPSDPRFLHDCRNCLLQAGSQTIRAGQTPFYRGSAHTYQPTRYHPAEVYEDVPLRQNIPCDWPYAVRRYNGSGVNSYHYQAKVLLAARDIQLETV